MKSLRVKFLVIFALFFSMQATGSVKAIASGMPVQFDGPFNYSGVSSASSIVSADFNGDGNPDLAVSGYSWIYILLGNSDGSFRTPEGYSVNSPYATVRSGDFNGDGKPDLAITNSSTNTVSILINNGNGSFSPKGDYYSGGDVPSYLATGDFNGDSKDDLAVMNYGKTIQCLTPPCPQPTTGINVSVLLGNGNGTFQSAIPTSFVDRPSALDVSDVNGDGRLDLAISIGKTIYLLNGLGNGSFQSPVSIGSSASTIDELHVADLNRDGIQDIVSISNGDIASIRLGSGNGEFLAPFNHEIGKNLLIHDLDGDGVLDITGVGTLYNYDVKVSLGKGDGTFHPAERYVGTGRYSKIVTGDFDHNGRPDLAIANFGNNSVSIFLNKGLKMVTPSSASFYWVRLLTTSAPSYFTIANPIGTPLNVSSINVSGTDSAMFSVTTGGGTPCPGGSFILAQGESCTIQATFTPASYNNKYASLVIASDHPVTPTVSIPLTGFATPPPSSTITSPQTGFVTRDNYLFVNGTASPSSGGDPVTQVEVSSDGGTTWSVASGTTNWTGNIIFHLPYDGVYKIKSRARAGTDVETPKSGITVTVDKTPPTGSLVFWYGEWSLNASSTTPGIACPAVYPTVCGALDMSLDGGTTWQPATLHPGTSGPIFIRDKAGNFAYVPAGSYSNSYGGPVQVARSTTQYYSLIQHAYDAGQSGDLIKVATGSTENLVLSRNTNLTIRGGYNSSFSAMTSTSPITGNLTLQAGSSLIENIELHGTILIEGGDATLSNVSIL